MASHSLIVGGSTAKRVINCPGSVALVAKMPPKDSSTYADRGTLLHNAMATILDSDTVTPESMLWTTYKDETLTGELLSEKILPALAALDEIDPEGVMEYAVETVVGFGAYLPGVFGSADLLGRLGSRAVVLDWKFGDGVAVSAEENEQGLFYAAAAMRTPETAWVFEGAEEVEIVIVQPPAVKRWVTTVKRVKEFERALKRAVKASAMPDAAIVVGDHCRWCAAKPLCPKMTGAVDRAVKVQLDAIDDTTLSSNVRRAASAMNIEIRPDHEPERNLNQRTDHWPFLRASVPATNFVFAFDPGTGAEHRYREWYQVRYHRPQDDMTQPLDWAAARDMNTFFYRLVEDIANDPIRPSFIPGSRWAPR